VKWVLYAAFAIVYGWIIYSAVFKLPPHPRNRILAALMLITVQVLFWALFEQAGSSLSLYTDRSVDRTIFGQEIKASVFQSLNAMYIVLLGPLFAAAWVWLGKRNMDPSAPAKFGLGVIQLGLGFLVLVWGANASGTAMTPVIFIFLIYLLHTTGELCLSPVGLSAMTRLSVPKKPAHLSGLFRIGFSSILTLHQHSQNVVHCIPVAVRVEHFADEAHALLMGLLLLSHSALLAAKESAKHAAKTAGLFAAH